MAEIPGEKPVPKHQYPRLAIGDYRERVKSS
jgi:hypothetical protein